MFNIFADVPASPRPLITPRPAIEPVIEPVTPDYTAVNIAVAAMAVTIIVIIVFTLLALKNRKKDDGKKSN